MRLVTFPNFSFAGAQEVNYDNVVAVGIAPCSIVDIALIGDQVLGPQSLLPFRAGMSIRPIRGFRTYALALPAIQRGSDVPDVMQNGVPGLDGSLSLLLYEKCDLLAPPGPRAPSVVYARAAGLQIPNGNYACMMRMLTHGRVAGSIFVRRTSGSITGCTIAFRFIKYYDAPTCRQMIANAGAPAYIDANSFVQDNSLALTFPASALNSVYTGDAWNDPLSKVLWWGGQFDNFRNHDEVEVWMGFDGLDTTGKNINTDWWIQGEAWGER